MEKLINIFVFIVCLCLSLNTAAGGFHDMVAPSANRTVFSLICMISLIFQQLLLFSLREKSQLIPTKRRKKMKVAFFIFVQLTVGIIYLGFKPWLFLNMPWEILIFTYSWPIFSAFIFFGIWYGYRINHYLLLGLLFLSLAIISFAIVQLLQGSFILNISSEPFKTKVVEFLLGKGGLFTLWLGLIIFVFIRCLCWSKLIFTNSKH